MCWTRRLAAERVFKVKEGRPNVVDLIKGDRIQLIVNTPRGQDTFFDEKAIRRAAVLARIPTITTIAAAQAAGRASPRCKDTTTTVYALQHLTRQNTPELYSAHRRCRVGFPDPAHWTHPGNPAGCAQQD